jgi:endonuclease YncB( thermonuclease family)
MPRIWYITVATLLLFVVLGPISAAERREWVGLTNCQYVAAKDNDGDSFRVRCDIKEFNLRLYFVDAPETNLRYPERTREQSEYFGVTLDDSMKAGAKARDTVQDILRGPFVVWTRWATAAGRGKETRYYALVEVGGKRPAEMLISQRWARTRGVSPNLPTGEKAKAYVERLERLESESAEYRTYKATFTRAHLCEASQVLPPVVTPHSGLSRTPRTVQALHRSGAPASGGGLQRSRGLRICRPIPCAPTSRYLRCVSTPCGVSIIP